MRHLPAAIFICMLAAFAIAGSVALQKLQEARSNELALLHAQIEAAERERAESWEWLRDSWLQLAQHSRERTDEMLWELRSPPGVVGLKEPVCNKPAATP